MGLVVLILVFITVAWLACVDCLGFDEVAEQMLIACALQ